MKRTTCCALAAALALAGVAIARAEPAAEIGRQVLAQYQTIQVGLATDSIDGVREAAAAIVETVKPCDCKLGEKEAADALVEAAKDMTGRDLETLREQFKALSVAMPAYLETTGVESAQLYYCPMVKAYWLQPKDDATTHNPYYGKAMSMCGVKVDKVAG